MAERKPLIIEMFWLRNVFLIICEKEAISNLAVTYFIISSLIQKGSHTEKLAFIWSKNEIRSHGRKRYPESLIR